MDAVEGSLHGVRTCGHAGAHGEKRVDNWPGPPPKYYDTRIVLKLVLLALVAGGLLLLGLRSPWLLRLGIVLGAGLAALVVAHIVYTVVRVQYANRWGVTRSVPATVVRKWTREPDLELSLEAPSEEGSLWVGFQLEHGAVELAVPEEVYAEVEEGMEGVLTYRGERLLSFLPSDESPEVGREEDEGPSRWRR